MGKQTVTRGVRNNNPGNIRKSKDKWQGLADEQSDRAFFTFKAPEWGIRALARVLIKYQDDYDLNTVRGLIGRWAPPNENDTGAYVNAVAKAMGVGSDDVIDVQQYDVLKPLTVAIIAHECAGYRYPDAVVDKGLALAGVTPVGKTVVVKPPQPPAAKDGGVIASVGGVISTVGVGTVVVAAQQGGELKTALEPLFGQWAVPIAAAFVIVSVGSALWLAVRVAQRRKTEAA